MDTVIYVGVYEIMEDIWDRKGITASSASGYPFLSGWICLEARLQGEEIPHVPLWLSLTAG